MCNWNAIHKIFLSSWIFFLLFFFNIIFHYIQNSSKLNLWNEVEFFGFSLLMILLPFFFLISVVAIVVCYLLLIPCLVRGWFIQLFYFIYIFLFGFLFSYKVHCVCNKFSNLSLFSASLVANGEKNIILISKELCITLYAHKKNKNKVKETLRSYACNRICSSLSLASVVIVVTKVTFIVWSWVLLILKILFFLFCSFFSLSFSNCTQAIGFFFVETVNDLNDVDGNERNN